MRCRQESNGPEAKATYRLNSGGPIMEALEYADNGDGSCKVLCEWENGQGQKESQFFHLVCLTPVN